MPIGLRGHMEMWVNMLYACQHGGGIDMGSTATLVPIDPKHLWVQTISSPLSGQEVLGHSCAKNWCTCL